MLLTSFSFWDKPFPPLNRFRANIKTHKMNTQHIHSNSLIHESSPYLLQHAHNPVNWCGRGDARGGVCCVRSTGGLSAGVA